MSRFSWNFAIENDIQLKDVLEWEKISWYFWAIFSTPCLITPAESTLGSSPLKICPVKVLPVEKTLNISPPQCI